MKRTFKIVVLLAVFMFSLQMVSAVLTDATFFYSFASSTTWDSGTNNLNATNFNANGTWNSTNGSWTFSGPINYVRLNQGRLNVTASAATFDSAAVSYGGWFYGNNVQTLSGRDVGLMGHAVGGASGYNLYYYNNHIDCQYKIGSWLSTSKTSYTFPNNAWHFYVCTLANGNQSLWIDGAIAAASTNAGTVAASDVGFSIGWLEGVDSGFNGTVAQAFLYPRQLTTAEITTLFNGGVEFNPYATINASIAVIAPANRSNITVANLTYIITNTDSTTDCSIVVGTVVVNTTYAILNQTITYAFNNTVGNWSWYVNCSNAATSLTSWFNIFTPSSSVSTTLGVNDPIGGNINSTFVLSYNITTTNPSINCSLRVNNTIVNSTPITVNGSYWHQFNTTTGPYSWNVNCTDGNTTANRSFIQESPAPFFSDSGVSGWRTYDDFNNNAINLSRWERLASTGTTWNFGKNGTVTIDVAGFSNWACPGVVGVSSSLGMQSVLNLSRVQYPRFRVRFAQFDNSTGTLPFKITTGRFNATLTGMNCVQPAGAYFSRGDTGPELRCMLENEDGALWDRDLIRTNFSPSWYWADFTYNTNGTVTASYYQDNNGQPGSLVAANSTSTSNSTNEVFDMNQGYNFRLLSWTGGSNLLVDKVEVYNRTADTYSVKGVISYNTVPVGSSRVLLINATDNTTITNTVTNSSGHYNFSGVMNGSHYVLMALLANGTANYSVSSYVNPTMVAD